MRLPWGNRLKCDLKWLGSPPILRGYHPTGGRAIAVSQVELDKANRFGHSTRHLWLLRRLEMYLFSSEVLSERRGDADADRLRARRG
jgi:hypothetical protein